mmetsp:Transcript_2086/g.4421  ORF Transcript_2086/g.4421 Transcript_2086/m.4421 type:complete len:230 (+) Transcript_2086:859-1548(+)
MAALLAPPRVVAVQLVKLPQRRRPLRSCPRTAWQLDTRRAVTFADLSAPDLAISAKTAPSRSSALHPGDSPRSPPRPRYAPLPPYPALVRWDMEIPPSATPPIEEARPWSRLCRHRTSRPWVVVTIVVGGPFGDICGVFPSLMRCLPWTPLSTAAQKTSLQRHRKEKVWKALWYRRLLSRRKRPLSEGESWKEWCCNLLLIHQRYRLPKNCLQNIPNLSWHLLLPLIRM